MTIEDSIALEEKLLPFHFHEMKRFLCSPGEIYWLKKNGKPVKVLDSGELMDEHFKAKYAKIEESLRIVMIIDPGLISEASLYFAGLKNSQNESMRLSNRNKLLKLFRDIYWDSTRGGSLQDLIEIGYKAFYSLDAEDEKNFRDASIIVYKRSALMGGVAVFLALAFGYLDYYFLQDFYHLFYFLDYSLERGELSFNILKACELERRDSGSGVEFLFFGDNPGPELETFKMHSERSLTLFKKMARTKLNDQSMVRHILMQHEKCNGKGFPYGINENAMSDLEAIMVLVNHLVSYNQMPLRGNDGMGFLRNVLIQYDRKDLSEVVSTRLRATLVALMDDQMTGEQPNAI